MFEGVDPAALLAARHAAHTPPKPGPRAKPAPTADRQVLQATRCMSVCESCGLLIAHVISKCILHLCHCSRPSMVSLIV